MRKPLLVGSRLSVAFPRRGTRGFTPWSGEGDAKPIFSGVVALQEVSVTVREGDVVAVVGSSGAGKSTLIRALACLQPVRSGEVIWDDIRVDHLPERLRRRWRHLVQMVFQEPGSGFNPRHTVGFALREALRKRPDIGARADSSAHGALPGLFSLVGLPFREEWLSRRISEFSGGQRQCLSLMRALAVGPKVLLLDEPVASLDVHLRREFLDVFKKLSEKTGLGVLLVTHDLSILAGLATHVVVLLAGRVVEEGPWPEVERSPLHPYTRALLETSRHPLGWQRFFVPTSAGCPYRLSCLWASPQCLSQPSLQDLGTRKVACFHPPVGNISREKLVQSDDEGG